MMQESDLPKVRAVLKEFHNEQGLIPYDDFTMALDLLGFTRVEEPILAAIQRSRMLGSGNI